MAKMPDMSPDFARWYAEAFMDEGTTRELRWKGVLALTAKPGFKIAEVLTRLAFQTPVSASGRKNEDLGETYNTVVSTISGGDRSFNPLQSTRELQILAAAALDRLFATYADAALVVTTASLGGLRRPDLPMDLPSLAEKALVRLSGRKHARTNADELKLAAPKVDFTIDAAALASMDAAQWKAQFEGLRDAAVAAIERVVAGQNRVVGLLHQQILLDEEELQMLWWLLGGYSMLRDQPFREIEAAIKPLALAHELGGMTAVSPGPASIRAMLSRAGVGTETLKLADVVNAVDLDWAKTVSNSTLVSPVTTPVHFALETRAELGSTDTWQAGWSGLTGLPADAPLPAVVLADQFYREHLFIRVTA